MSIQNVEFLNIWGNAQKEVNILSILTNIEDLLNRKRDSALSLVMEAVSAAVLSAVIATLYRYKKTFVSWLLMFGAWCAVSAGVIAVLHISGS